MVDNKYMSQEESDRFNEIVDIINNSDDWEAFLVGDNDRLSVIDLNKDMPAGIRIHNAEIGILQEGRVLRVLHEPG